MEKQIKNKVIIYRFTGRQGFFTIPKSWCEECDLLVFKVKDVLRSKNLEHSTTFIIRPWFLWFWLPLFQYGSFHAPILIINRKFISGGVVPSREKIVDALKTSDGSNHG